MRPIGRWMMVFVCTVTVGCFSVPSPAKSRGMSRQSSGRSRSSGKAPAPKKVNPNLAPDEAAANAANAAVVKAENTLNGVKGKLETAFHASSDWTSAQAGLQQAQTDYKAAIVPVLAALKSSNAGYAAALDNKEKISADLVTARADVPPDPVAALATSLLAATQVARNFEIAALDADAGATAAKEKVATATTAMDTLSADFEKSCAQDKDWSAAKADYDAAKAKADKAYAKVKADGG
jgi:hypothetical protein